MERRNFLIHNRKLGKSVNIFYFFVPKWGTAGQEREENAQIFSFFHQREGENQCLN